MSKKKTSFTLSEEKVIWEYVSKLRYLEDAFKFASRDLRRHKLQVAKYYEQVMMPVLEAQVSVKENPLSEIADSMGLSLPWLERFCKEKGLVVEQSLLEQPAETEKGYVILGRFKRLFKIVKVLVHPLYKTVRSFGLAG